MSLCKAPQSKKIVWVMILVGLILANFGLVSASTWNSTLDEGLTLYYPFNNLTEAIKGIYNLSNNQGSLVYNTSNCLIGKCGQFSSGNNLNTTTDLSEFNMGFGNKTINFWVRTENAQKTGVPVLISKKGILNGFMSTGDGLNLKLTYSIRWIGSSSSTAEWINQSWYMITYTRDDSGLGKIYLNGTLKVQGTGTFTNENTSFILGAGSDGASNLIGQMDEFGVWNRTLTQNEITQLFNEGSGISYSTKKVTLNSPLNNTVIISTIINSFTADVRGISMTNATLYIWNNTSSQVTKAYQTLSGSNSGINFTLNQRNITLGTGYKWNILLCDNEGCDMPSSNYTFNATNYFIENSQTYNAAAYESSDEEFIINITYDSGYYTSVSGNLIYNGTLYSGSVSGTENNAIISRTITLPTVISTTTKNFIWQIAMTNSSGTYYFNSTANTQSINTIQFYLCNATYNVSFINFTIRKAMTPYTIINSTFNVKWQIGIGSSVSRRNSTYQDTSGGNSTFSFCIIPTYENYITDAQIEYDAEGYAKNFYYLDDANLTNSTSLIDLYLLNDSLATLTVLKVVDNSQTNLENVIIQIQMYDIGTDTYYTTAMAKTSYNGEDLAYLNWYDTLYKFILLQNGQVVKTINPFKISETPQKFQTDTSLFYTYDKFRNFQYTLTFNNATNNFIFTYVKPSGLVQQACLKVVKRGSLNDTLVCENCESSASATLYCNIGSYGNGTFIAHVYATGSNYPLDLQEIVIGITGFSREVYNLIGNIDGTTYAIIASLIVLVMFLISPVFAIIGAILGMVGAMVLGFQPINQIQFIGIVIVGGVVIWLLKR